MSREELIDFLEEFSLGPEFREISNRISYDVFIRYAESHRFYHNMQHILMGLQNIKCLRYETDIDEFDKRTMDCLEFAWWYHDIVYDPKRSDNEEVSALVADSACDTLELFDDKNKISHFIRATKIGHVAQNIYEKYIQDIDMTIFGKDSLTVFEYDDNIRREYDFVDDETFKRERGKILRKFLDEDIYKTKYFRNQYEGIAISNIRALIEKRY